MPARNDRTAPVFDSQQPRNLPKYFSDLDFLLSRSRIADDSEKKYHATRFLTLDDQELWELVPEFTDPATSFAQFTAAIFRLYPEADPDRRYSLQDLDALVTEFSRTESLSRARFTEFYRRFFVISTFLLAKDRLSVHEQSRSFVRAIPTHVWQPAHIHLRIACPNVHPCDPYSLPDLRDAVDFVLLDSPSQTLLPSPPPPPTSIPVDSVTIESPVSTPADPFMATLIEATKQLVAIVSSQQAPSPAASQLDLQLPSSQRPASCSYCSDPAHFLARCPLASADIRTGICKRNAEGKVVLPSGSFVPHRIAGPNLRTRISSWHSENSARYAPVSESPHAAVTPHLSPSL
ncbi:hypothetical protein DFH08DRAFT_622811, partial [Mycena albidolilacea]